MYCPRCGKADQTPKIYCRGCGLFLEDFSKPAIREIPVEQHLKVNSFLSLGTAVISSVLAVLLFLTLIRPGGTPWIIYVVFGFLITITAWQIQTFIGTRLLKKQFERLTPPKPEPSAHSSHLRPADTARHLESASFDSAIPASITEDTTRHLDKNER